MDLIITEEPSMDEYNVPLEGPVVPLDAPLAIDSLGPLDESNPEETELVVRRS